MTTLLTHSLPRALARSQAFSLQKNVAKLAAALSLAGTALWIAPSALAQMPPHASSQAPHQAPHHAAPMSKMRDMTSFGHGQIFEEKHVQRMSKAAGANAEQQTKLSAIAKAAQTDLAPLWEQMRTAHIDGMKLLSANTIDRAQIEQHRQQQLRLHEQISSRTTQALVDAALVLTPEQRTKLATLMQQHSQRMNHHEGASSKPMSMEGRPPQPHEHRKLYQPAQ